MLDVQFSVVGFNHTWSRESGRNILTWQLNVSIIWCSSRKEWEILPEGNLVNYDSCEWWKLIRYIRYVIIWLAKIIDILYHLIVIYFVTSVKSSIERKEHGHSLPAPAESQCQTTNQFFVFLQRKNWLLALNTGAAVEHC